MLNYVCKSVYCLVIWLLNMSRRFYWIFLKMRFVEWSFKLFCWNRKLFKTMLYIHKKNLKHPKSQNTLNPLQWSLMIFCIVVLKENLRKALKHENSWSSSTPKNLSAIAVVKKKHYNQTFSTSFKNSLHYPTVFWWKR